MYLRVSVNAVGCRSLCSMYDETMCDETVHGAIYISSLYNERQNREFDSVWSVWNSTRHTPSTY